MENLYTGLNDRPYWQVVSIESEQLCFTSCSNGFQTKRMLIIKLVKLVNNKTCQTC